MDYVNVEYWPQLAGRMELNESVGVEIFIPVFNEESILARSLHTLHAWMKRNFPYPWMITIVDNGSTDRTLSIAIELAQVLKGVNAISVSQRGRGLALRTAWAASSAEIVAYMDVDLSASLDYLLPLIGALVEGRCDLAIGTRLAPGASTVRGPVREILSRVYNVLVRFTQKVPFSDTQCGFKAANARAIRPLLALARNDSWFFDTELLLLAYWNALRIKEVPVAWIDEGDSKVALVRTVLEDVNGLIRMARMRLSGAGIVGRLRV